MIIVFKDVIHSYKDNENLRSNNKFNLYMSISLSLSQLYVKVFTCNSELAIFKPLTRIKNIPNDLLLTQID